MARDFRCEGSILRSRAAAERSVAAALNEKRVLRLAMVGLRSRHHGESVAKLRRRLLGLVLGETACKIYGPLDHEQ